MKYRQWQDHIVLPSDIHTTNQPTTSENEIETIEGRTGGETPITNTTAPLPTPTLPDTPVPPSLSLQALPPALPTIFGTSIVPN
jgi:hypothetical protein